MCERKTISKRHRVTGRIAPGRTHESTADEKIWLALDFTEQAIVIVGFDRLDTQMSHLRNGPEIMLALGHDDGDYDNLEALIKSADPYNLATRSSRSVC